MKNDLLSALVDGLWQRAIPEGGFKGKPDGMYRPDATAWATLALSLTTVESGLLLPARLRLVRSQLKDGSVPISPQYPQVSWPTPLAVLAWHGIGEFDAPKSKAIHFLLNTSGTHWKKTADAAAAHDTALKGWPWTVATHSWVEPTAFRNHRAMRVGIRQT